MYPPDKFDMLVDSQWASVPGEMLGACQATSLFENWSELRFLPELQRLPSLVKIQLVCKAWYKEGGKLTWFLV